MTGTDGRFALKNGQTAKFIGTMDEDDGKTVLYYRGGQRSELDRSEMELSGRKQPVVSMSWIRTVPERV